MADNSVKGFVAREEVAGAITASQQDVAAYVATLARDLKRMVERHNNLETLTHLLELVELESLRNSNGKHLKENTHGGPG